MSTPRDLIRDSLLLFGGVASSEPVSADDQSDAFRALNRMISTWSTQKLMIFDEVRETFPLVAGQQVYTIGPGGNFDTARPQELLKVLFQYQVTGPNNELPVRVLILDQWAQIGVKDTQSEIVTKVYLETSFPLAKLYCWPVPSVVKNLILYSLKPLSAFASVDTVISLPPAYEEAIVSNLAIRLAPSYGRSASAEVLEMALESKSGIERNNNRPFVLKNDAALVGGGQTFNWLTGDDT